MVVASPSSMEFNLSKDFLQASQKGNLAKIMDLKAKYNIQDWTIYRHDISGDTPLHLAAREGHIDVVRYLCEAWYQPQFKADVTNKDMKRPLHEAAQFARSDTLEYLVRQGVEIDSLKRADWTPLMLACTKEGSEACRCVDTLLKAGANPYLRNKDGWTPLHIACRTGDVSIVNLLLKHAPDSVKTRSNNGRSPLHIAAFHGCLEVIDLLVQKDSDLLKSQDSLGSTPLLESAKSDNLPVMELLISLGADIKAVDNVKQNILHVAAQTGNLNVVRHILQNRLINVNATALFGITPLIAARRGGNNEIVKMLLDCETNK